MIGPGNIFSIAQKINLWGSVEFLDGINIIPVQFEVRPEIQVFTCKTQEQKIRLVLTQKSLLLSSSVGRELDKIYIEFLTCTLGRQGTQQNKRQNIPHLYPW